MADDNMKRFIITIDNSMLSQFKDTLLAMNVEIVRIVSCLPDGEVLIILHCSESTIRTLSCVHQFTLYSSSMKITYA